MVCSDIIDCKSLALLLCLLNVVVWLHQYF